VKDFQNLSHLSPAGLFYKNCHFQQGEMAAFLFTFRRIRVISQSFLFTVFGLISSFFLMVKKSLPKQKNKFIIWFLVVQMLFSRATNIFFTMKP